LAVLSEGQCLFYLPFLMGSFFNKSCVQKNLCFCWNFCLTSRCNNISQFDFYNVLTINKLIFPFCILNYVCTPFILGLLLFIVSFLTVSIWCIKTIMFCSVQFSFHVIFIYRVCHYVRELKIREINIFIIFRVKFIN